MADENGSIRVTVITNMAASMPIRVLELYSGIGGMHWALSESGISFSVVAAYDVNVNTNKIYKTNFTETPVVDRAIEALSLKQFENMEIDMILMSPPCQPFTRVGKQKDSEDVRTRSFLHILHLLKRTLKPPKYLLVENVKGFDVSRTREALLEALKTVKYKYKEFLLTPLQFGIPNSRLRYFLIAKREPFNFSFETSDEILTAIPDCPQEWMPHKMKAQAEEESETSSGSDVRLDKPCTCGGYISDPVQKFSQPGQGSANVDTTIEPCVKKIKTSHAPESRIDLCASQKLEGNETLLVSERLHEEGVLRVSENIPVASSENGRDSSRSSYETKHTIDITDCSSGSSSRCEQSQNFKQEASTECNSDSSSILEQTQVTKEVTVTEDSMKESNVCEPGVRWDCLEKYGLNMRQCVQEGSSSYGPCLKMSHFLQPKGNTQDDKVKECMIQEKDLKRFLVMDVVTPCSRKSNCFTKRYGRFMEGAGSVIQTTSDIQALERASRLKQEAVAEKCSDRWGKTEMDVIRQLGLRYFTPRETANVLCFPQSFSFPPDLTVRQLYMALGNSLNVHIVAVLIKLLTYQDHVCDT